MSIKDTAKQYVKNAISDYLTRKDGVVKTVQPLDFIFPEQRKIRSIIGGLETSLGTRLWETLAKELAKKNGFTVFDEKELNKSVPEIPENLRHFLSNLEKEKTRDPATSLEEMHQSILNFIKDEVDTSNLKMVPMPKGEGVDLWLSKDEKDYLIDIKTVQINAGGGPKFLGNLINWHAYRALSGQESVKTMIAFPFNPHDPNDFWAREKGKVLPMNPSVDALVADEFWDFITDKQNSTAEIMEAFKELGSDKDLTKFF